MLSRCPVFYRHGLGSSVLRCLIKWNIGTNKIVVTFLILLLLLIVGMFLDGTSAVIILAPILFPLAASYGFDPIHFGVFMVVSLLTGGITPPVGILL